MSDNIKILIGRLEASMKASNSMGKDGDSPYFAGHFSGVCLAIQLINEELGGDDDKATLVTNIDTIKDEIYTYFAYCPNNECNNGSVVKGSNYCNGCGTRLSWPEEKEGTKNEQ